MLRRGSQRSDLAATATRCASGGGQRAVRQEFGGFHDHDAARDQRADGYPDGHVEPHSSTAVLTLLPPLQLSLDVEHGGGREFRERHGDAGRSRAGDGRHRDAAIRRYRLCGFRRSSIPAGQNSQTFTITTSMVTRPAHGDDYGDLRGLARQTVLLTVNPPPPPTLVTLTITPDHVMGGTSTQGTVTLDRPGRSRRSPCGFAEQFGDHGVGDAEFRDDSAGSDIRRRSRLRRVALPGWSRSPRPFGEM